MCKREGRARMLQWRLDRRSKIRNINFCFLLVVVAVVVVVGGGVVRLRGSRGREGGREDDGLLRLRGLCRRRGRWRKRMGWVALVVAVVVVVVVVEEKWRRVRGRRDRGVCSRREGKRGKGEGKRRVKYGCIHLALFVMVGN